MSCPCVQEEKGSGLGLPVKTLTGEVVYEAKAKQLKASQLKHKVCTGDKGCITWPVGWVGLVQQPRLCAAK